MMNPCWRKEGPAVDFRREWGRKSPHRSLGWGSALCLPFPVVVLWGVLHREPPGRAFTGAVIVIPVQTRAFPRVCGGPCEGVRSQLPGQVKLPYHPALPLTALSLTLHTHAHIHVHTELLCAVGSWPREEERNESSRCSYLLKFCINERKSRCL